MKNFLIGLGICVAGITAAVVFRLLYGFSGLGDEGSIGLFNFLMWIGVALIFLGPLYFWLISPVMRRLRRAR
jgi:hypothetical protein